MKERRKLILHCGLPKTGTTALQLWCRQHRQALLQLGVDYPDPLARFEPKQEMLLPALRSPNKIMPLVGMLEMSDAPAVFMSHEGLTNHLYDFPEPARAGFRNLTSAFDTTVVLITREKDSWLRSYYRQCVLNPANGASDLWATSRTLREIRDHPRIAALLNHCQLERDLKHGLGGKNVLRFSYEDPDWFPNLLNYIGAGVLAHHPLAWENDGLPEWVVEMLRQINDQCPGPQAWLASRQAVQRYLQTKSVILRQAEEQPATFVNPEILKGVICPESWSEAEKHAFLAFAEFFRINPGGTSSA